MGEIIDKTKGKINQAGGDLTGNKSIIRGREGRTQGQVEGAVSIGLSFVGRCHYQTFREKGGM